MNLSAKTPLLYMQAEEYSPFLPRRKSEVNAVLYLVLFVLCWGGPWEPAANHTAHTTHAIVWGIISHLHPLVIFFCPLFNVFLPATLATMSCSLREPALIIPLMSSSFPLFNKHHRRSEEANRFHRKQKEGGQEIRNGERAEWGRDAEKKTKKNKGRCRERRN